MSLALGSPDAAAAQGLYESVQQTFEDPSRSNAQEWQEALNSRKEVRVRKTSFKGRTAAAGPAL